MSSDEEDYDSDTNWDEMVAVSAALSQQRHVPGSVDSPVLEPLAAIARPAAQDNHVGISSINKISRRQAILAALSSEVDTAREPELSTTETRKRKRSMDTLGSPVNQQPQIVESPTRANLKKIISGYDDELSCPICLDFLVAPQLLNPCGHTLCGDCLAHCLSKSTTRQCPTCRVHLSHPLCNLPNFAISGAVDRYIELQRSNRDADWLDEGSKWKERQSRKRAYEVIKATNRNPVPTISTNWPTSSINRPTSNTNMAASISARIVAEINRQSRPHTTGRRQNNANRQAHRGRGSAPGTDHRARDGRRGRRRRRRTAATTTNNAIELSSDEYY